MENGNVSDVKTELQDETEEEKERKMRVIEEEKELYGEDYGEEGAK